MENIFKNFKPTTMMIWGKLKKIGTTVKLAVVYFVQGVVKSLMTSLCILAGAGSSK